MSIHFYPVTPTDVRCEDYHVKVNGVPVSLNTARVSAYPINRRWPGHQRSQDQSELINFLSFSADKDEELHFEIIPAKPFEKVEIRPKSLGITPVTTPDGTIKFTLKKPAYFTVEPYGRHHALHIFADPVTDYQIDPQDENVIYFGAGEHEAGQIALESNQTLFLDEGAVVYACVTAMDADNIKILGRGILDNSHNKEHILFEYSAENNDTAIKNATRQHTVQLEYCNNVTIEGITIRDSLVYNIRPIGCNDLHISNVKIIGCWRYNSDGIDMHNCVNVLIENCFLRTFDDAICVKGFDCYYKGDVEAAVKAAMYRNGKSYDVFQNVRVRNCTIWNDWGKSLEIGAETKAEEICDIIFEDCDIIHVLGAPLDSFNIDYADVHDVAYRNISVEYDDEIPAPVLQAKDSELYCNPDPDFAPHLICVITDYHHEYSVGSTRRGKSHDITFENIRLYGRQMPKLYFKGYDEEHMTKDILIKGLYWNDAPVASLDKEHLIMDVHTANIQIAVSDSHRDESGNASADAYEQLSKNTVKSQNQLSETKLVRFENPYGAGTRIMFVGNSITLHGIKHDIGWHNEWGMAASAKEKDYVHRVISAVREKDSDASFCICQVAEWERSYKNGSSTYHLFENAQKFNADVIILRLIENCPAKDFDEPLFRSELEALIAFLNPSGRAKIILTTGFWRHPGDSVITKLAADMNYPLVLLGDLGEDPAMKAIGLFEHEGVANHPGDLGMEKIAERILERM